MFGDAILVPPGGDASERAIGPLPGSAGQLTDADIRAALSVGQPARAALGDTVLEEVECWRGYVRADYVCLSGNALSIIEIKSDRDTLRRFPEQVRVYSSFADRVTLVVGWTLAARALRIAPVWWDVLLAERNESSSVRFVALRDGVRNPDIGTAGLVAMLPIDQVQRLARYAGLRTKTRSRELRRQVAEFVDHEDLRTAVRDWVACLSAQRAGTPS
ncbi:MAG: sce7726 family protein [Dehalococcoidia bacterium]